MFYVIELERAEHYKRKGGSFMLKKISSLFIAAALFFVLGAVTAFAEEMDVRYLYTTSCASSLQVSGTTGTCYSTIVCPITTTKIEITQTLQVKDGNQWRAAHTWTKTVYCTDYNFVNTRTLYSGNTYRVKTQFKVYQGTNSETIYAYSRTKSV